MNQEQNIYKQYMYSYPHKSAYRAIEAEVIGDYLKQVQGGTLYSHIPFCESKCGYCNLFSKVPIQNEIENYLEAVKRQMEQYAYYIEASKRNIAFKEVILGGGTPLILSENQLERLFQMLEEAFNIKVSSAFMGIETSPHQTDLEKIKYIKQRGMNRISIGVQSFQDQELQTLKRRHLSADAHRALKLLKEVDFHCLNIDLIYGIPGQTLESLKISLEQAISYAPDEIFIYPLYIRKYTGLYGMTGVSQTLKQEMYHYLAEYLKAAGYTQLSMRRFARHETVVTSCGFEEMIAVGCGGRSYIGNLHFCEPYHANPKKCAQTIHSFSQKENFIEGLTGYVLNTEEQKRRFVIKNLMSVRGIELKAYKQLWAVALEQDFPIIKMLIEKSWVEQINGFIRLTKVGLGLSDCIGALFMSEEVVQRMEEGEEGYAE